MNPSFAIAVAEIPASRVLAAVFALVFLAIVFAGSWHGYWRGPLRQIAPLAAFVFAGTLAWLFGSELGFAVLGKIGVPWILRGISGVLLVGILAWLPVFSILWARGRKQVSEETGEPHLPVLGAVVGCWTGGLWVAALVLVIISAGTIGDALLCGRRNPTKSILGKCAYSASVAKKSVALIPGFAVAGTLQIVPEKMLRTLNKLVDVLGNARACYRFFDMPEVLFISSLPSVYPVVNSPEIREMVRRRDIEGLPVSYTHLTLPTKA